MRTRTILPFFYALFLASTSSDRRPSAICSATHIRVVHASHPKRDGETSPSPQEVQDMRTVHARRVESIIGSIPSDSASHVPSWLHDLDADGKWPDSQVDYSTGCSARRANWPAQVHWIRIQTMAAAWRGGLSGTESLQNDPTLRQSISLAMSYWFSRDYTNLACLDAGGTDSCPCSTTENSLWNTNWFSNVILIPEYVGATCLLLNDTLMETEYNNCLHFTTRPYGLFSRPIYNMRGGLTGANAVDVAKTAVDGGVLSLNATLVLEAYRRAQSELVIQDTVLVDGIRRDGAFAQHSGIIYNGNYGKDYSNAIIDLEIESAGTSFSAEPSARRALETLFDGNKWMIFKDPISNVLHWDFSVLGRFLTFPVADDQATGSIKTNLTRVRNLGEIWSSTTLIDYATDLQRETTHANAGNLIGNQSTSEQVHRGPGYVSSVRMYSSRTVNTECINSQNPLGFHLSDGAHYTWLRGDEYKDITAAWDWNKIPGITTDYGNTPLTCGSTRAAGIESFVGGVSTGQVGIAVMRFNNPVNRSLQFQKTWFFLEDNIQHVAISGLTSNSSSVISVLDQKRHRGPVLVNGEEVQSVSNAEARTLWHSDIGYVFPDDGSSSLSIEVGEKIGSWSAIGTSTQPPITVDLFSAWIQHPPSLEATSYTVFPARTAQAFHHSSRRRRVHSINNDQQISAVYDDHHDIAMVVFWSSEGGCVSFQSRRNESVTISASGNSAVIYRRNQGLLTVSNPSQTLESVRVEIRAEWKGQESRSSKWPHPERAVVDFSLPSGGLAGSSVTKSIA